MTTKPLTKQEIMTDENVTDLIESLQAKRNPLCHQAAIVIECLTEELRAAQTEIFNLKSEVAALTPASVPTPAPELDPEPEQATQEQETQSKPKRNGRPISDAGRVIRQLITEGKTAKQLKEMGYSYSTVYAIQQRMKNGHDHHP